MPDIDFETEENKQLLANLYAYSRGLFNQIFPNDPNWRGKGFRDYVQDAICKHLMGEDNFVVGRSPLEYHLKYHVIRQAITNDVPPAAKKAYRQYRTQSQEEREMQLKIDIEGAPIDPDELSDFTLVMANFESEHLFKEIESEINGDEVVEQIYLAVVYDKYHFSERAEICRDFKIDPTEFDNGKRRLITILKRIFKKFNIKADYGS